MNLGILSLDRATICKFAMNFFLKPLDTDNFNIK